MQVFPASNQLGMARRYCENSLRKPSIIGLPEMDGYQLVRRLRATLDSDGAWMIALTEYSQSHDRVIGKAAGFDDYFVKPIDIARLDQILGQLAPPDAVAA